MIKNNIQVNKEELKLQLPSHPSNFINFTSERSKNNQFSPKEYDRTVLNLIQLHPTSSI